MGNRFSRYRAICSLRNGRRLNSRICFLTSAGTISAHRASRLVSSTLQSDSSARVRSWAITSTGVSIPSRIEPTSSIPSNIVTIYPAFAKRSNVCCEIDSWPLRSNACLIKVHKEAGSFGFKVDHCPETQSAKAERRACSAPEVSEPILGPRMSFLPLLVRATHRRRHHRPKRN